MKQVLIATLALMLLAAGAASAAQTAMPTPLPSTPPKHLTYSGFMRSYYFTRTNTTGYGLPQSTNVLNQQTFNPALNLHAAYGFANHWSVAGTYLYANPLDDCASAVQQMQSGGPCSGKKIAPATNPDNTLPAFRLSTLYEAYVAYSSTHFKAKLGDQLLTTPWANSADTRLKPEAYRGADVFYALRGRLSFEGAYVNRFESRVDSDFINSTLLTATNMADAPGPGANLLLPKYSSIATSGFEYLRAAYGLGSVSANAYFYNFADIAAAEWFDAKWTLNDPLHRPFIALQGGTERNAGKSVIGKIDSQVVGLQAGFSPLRTLDITIGADYIPQKSDTLTLPSGVSCNAVPAQPPTKTPAGHAISVTGTIPFMYFLPAGGTPDCTANANGTTTVYYGGWASPYTDSYTSDPLFTTSMTGGMVERRSSGASAKATAAWSGDARRVRLIASFALYSYGNNATGVTPSREVDIDGSYFFSPVPKDRPYRGFMLRHRYGDRDMSNTALYGGLPVFKYNRTQVEYDF